MLTVRWGVTLSTLIALLTGCPSGGTGSGDAGLQQCVTVPPPAFARVDPSRDARAATEGCRAFDHGECQSCCKPTRSIDGRPLCLRLDARGESLSEGECPEACAKCAECTLEMETTLRGFPDQRECACSEPRASLGCKPADPCDCYCLDLEDAASWCSHLVCAP